MKHLPFYQHQPAMTSNQSQTPKAKHKRFKEPAAPGFTSLHRCSLRSASDLWRFLKLADARGWVFETKDRLLVMRKAGGGWRGLGAARKGGLKMRRPPNWAFSGYLSPSHLGLSRKDPRRSKKTLQGEAQSPRSTRFCSWHVAGVLESQDDRILWMKHRSLRSTQTNKSIKSNDRERERERER